ncbi:MAG: MFS transporter [Kineosporiaceae bacterium]
MPDPEDDYTPDPRRWKAFTVCLIAGFMALLDVSIVNVALPSIREGLGAGPSQVQWVVAGYALSFGLVLVAFGRLGDVRGRRPVFLVGLSLFTLSSAVCGLAPGPNWLVAARLVQGMAGGMINPQTSGLVQQLFRGAERGRAFGLLGATIGLSTAVGPVTGGALIAAFGTDHGWRAVFFVNVPVGILAVVMAWRLLPAPKRSERRQGLDPVGALLLALALLAVLVPLVESRAHLPVPEWALLAAGAALLVVFVAWERRVGAAGGDPMVDLRLFREPSYALGSTLGLVYFAGFTAIFFVLAQYFQSGLGYSALESGLAVTPFAVGSAVASGWGGRIVTRVGRPLVVAGLLAVVVGLAVASWLLGHGPDGVPLGVLVAPALLVAGVGSGLVIAPNITLTLTTVPVARAGSAGGVLQTGQRIGSALGVAVVGAVFFARLGAGGTGGGRSAGPAVDAAAWTPAARDALTVCVAVVAVALLLAALDVGIGRARQGRARVSSATSSRS